jgi:hypothetical protein
LHFERFFTSLYQQYEERFVYGAPSLANRTRRLIPNPADQDRCAQLRRPIDMIVHGWSTRLFQAKQQ